MITIGSEFNQKKFGANSFEKKYKVKMHKIDIKNFRESNKNNITMKDKKALLSKQNIYLTIKKLFLV